MRYLVTLLLISSSSCKSMQGGRAAAQIPAPVSGPASCAIRGRVIDVFKGPENGDPAYVCNKYPCRAHVEITEIYSCGSSVFLPLNVGDTLDMSFAYTLSNTALIFPGMKEHYPGMKPGSRFTANAEQRPRPGIQGEFVIYGYRVQ